MDKKQLAFATSDQPRQNVLFEFERDGVGINFGTVILKKGIRIPENGFTRHLQHEISYVQSGKIQLLNIDGSEGDMLVKGDVVSIAAKEPQAGVVLETTKIIYILIG